MIRACKEKEDTSDLEPVNLCLSFYKLLVSFRIYIPEVLDSKILRLEEPLYAHSSNKCQWQ